MIVRCAVQRLTQRSRVYVPNSTLRLWKFGKIGHFLLVSILVVPPLRHFGPADSVSTPAGSSVTVLRRCVGRRLDVFTPCFRVPLKSCSQRSVIFMSREVPEFYDAGLKISLSHTETPTLQRYFGKRIFCR